MRRTLYLVYGIACHLLFLLTFAWLFAFVGNLLLPKTIDHGATSSLPIALAVNSFLILLFALQHSIMARPAFKAWWTTIIPRPIERSTYVLLSCFFTALLIVLWQPIDAIVWNITHPVAWGAMWALFVAGWLLVPAVTLLINHFDLCGTRQVWLHWQEQ